VFPVADPASLGAITRALARYADTIRPWAAERAAEMLTASEHQDKRAWTAATRSLGAGIREELKRAPIAQVMSERMATQVKLITSLPTDAATRVQKLTMEALSSGTRAASIAKEIKRTGEVTEARANLIARTEVSRTSTLLTEARAQSVGSEGYIWRTAGDTDVRDSHRLMEGKFVAWTQPPKLDGLVGHAGALPRCRCYPEPVIPKPIE